MRKSLPDDHHALIEYFLGDSVLCIFTLTQSGYDVTTVNRDSDFEEKIKAMREGIGAHDFDRYTENASALYRTLIEPVESKIKGKDLIIIPDGILGTIPFEALLTSWPDPEIQDYSKLSYLIRTHSIAYDYSSTMFVENRANRRNTAAGGYVGFAPMTYK